MSDAESVGSELVGPRRSITATTAAFCFVVSEAIVSIHIITLVTWSDGSDHVEWVRQERPDHTRRSRVWSGRSWRTHETWSDPSDQVTKVMMYLLYTYKNNNNKARTIQQYMHLHKCKVKYYGRPMWCGMIFFTQVVIHHLFTAERIGRPPFWKFSSSSPPRNYKRL